MGLCVQLRPSSIAACTVGRSLTWVWSRPGAHDLGRFRRKSGLLEPNLPGTKVPFSGGLVILRFSTFAWTLPSLRASYFLRLRVVFLLLLLFLPKTQ